MTNAGFTKQWLIQCKWEGERRHKTSFFLRHISLVNTQYTAPGCAKRDVYKYTVHSNGLTLSDLVEELMYEVKVKQDYKTSSRIIPCYMWSFSYFDTTYRGYISCLKLNEEEIIIAKRSELIKIFLMLQIYTNPVFLACFPLRMLNFAFLKMMLVSQVFLSGA